MKMGIDGANMSDEYNALMEIRKKTMQPISICETSDHQMDAFFSKDSAMYIYDCGTWRQLPRRRK